MAPKGKKRDSKKSHHQSVQSVPGVIPGTSTLSLPNFGSNFPGDFDPNTPSYSLDLCRLLLETEPNSNTYYDFFIHYPIQELIINLLTVHGLSNNAQAVKDYRNRIRGNHPTPSLDRSTKNIISDLNLSLQQKQSVIESIYKNYMAATEYYEKKSKEAAEELKSLDVQLRESILAECETFHVTEGEQDTTTNEDTKKDNQTTEETVEGETKVEDSAKKEIVEKSQKMKKKKFKKLQSLWEIASAEGTALALSTETEEDDTDDHEDEGAINQKDDNTNTGNNDVDDEEDESLLGAVGGTPSTRPKKKKSDIIVPFNPSQMHIPILRPNFIIPSDIGSSELTADQNVEDKEKTAMTETITEVIPEERIISHTSQDPQPSVDERSSGQTQAEESSRSESDDNQGDGYGGLRLPTPISERREKYPKDEETDEPIVMSPAALGGTTYRITSNVPQMPIGTPRSYEVLEK